MSDMTEKKWVTKRCQITVVLYCLAVSFMLNYVEIFSNNSHPPPSLNEWNMNKLGWYKVQDGYDTIRESTVREAFVASTENCGENKLKTSTLYLAL